MKKIYCDREQSVFIKVFNSSLDMEKEVFGLKSFSNLSLVPKVKRIDSKTLEISKMEGFLSYQVEEGRLNLLVAGFLLSKKEVSTLDFSISSDLEKFKKFFNTGKYAKKIKRIEDKIKTVKMIPVHGDLQKQNITVNGANLGLIDFERFCFAPPELELCNSLFFNDGNCLDVSGICKLLPNGLFNKEMFKVMLNFYYLKQIYLGMGVEEADTRLKIGLKRVLNLKLGRKKVNLGLTSTLCYL